MGTIVQVIVSIVMLFIIAMLLIGMNKILNGDASMTEKESLNYKKELRKSASVISVRSIFSQLLMRKDSEKTASRD